MAKEKKYCLAICLTTFCICLLLFTPITKTAWPQDKAEIQSLIIKLKNPSAKVRQDAARVLGDIGPEAKAALPALIQALNDESVAVRAKAAEALRRIGPEAKATVPALIEALKDENGVVNKRAAVALGEIATALRDAKATEMIKDLKAAKKALSAYPKLKKQENIVRRAIEFLEQIKPPLWTTAWWKLPATISTALAFIWLILEKLELAEIIVNLIH